jgi:acyl-CoA reductase-like NAD-dependent aldehyde dehydrogenase/proline dehydrogenase
MKASQRAVQLAGELFEAAASGQSRQELAQARRLARMVEVPEGKGFTMAMVDHVYRSNRPQRQAAEFREILDEYGMPDHLSPMERFLLRAAAFVSRFVPRMAMSAVSSRIRRESSRVVVPGERLPLARYLAERRASGMRVNLNHLGEAVLGEDEAARRMDAILDHLRDPAVTYVSVKISAIFSRINLLDWDGTLAKIKDRLRRLYRAAMAHPDGITGAECKHASACHPERSEGSLPSAIREIPSAGSGRALLCAQDDGLTPSIGCHRGAEEREQVLHGTGATPARPAAKFINLDMEEYRDLHLTLAAFKEVLEEPEFMPLRAGIVLQAYLPDSWTAQQELTEWARKRIASGGAPIKLRIVKGANLAMESVEAEMHGWERAPYASKEETDANFKRMLEFGCARENARAVNIGVASHNLFDVALAMVLREQNGVHDFVEMEMLEGMANHQARAVRSAAGGLVVYAPAVKREDFNSALAYLVRRLDENTAPGNFLRDMFGITPGSPAWARQRDRFLAAWEARHTVCAEPRRAHRLLAPEAGFHNAVDTDWTQAGNRAALSRALTEHVAPTPPAADDLNRVLETARAAQPAWESLGHIRRRELLKQCGTVMERQRFGTIACMVHDARKAAAEADAEVSEAVDFANYYAEASPLPADVRAKALGVVVVAPPWNFPYAIPAGGVLPALMAGNAVILKPSPETIATAWRLADQLWEAGIPRDVLQFFPCADGGIGRSLITDPRVDAVVLTGAYDTARMFLDWRPALRLFAETSGKNAIVVTAQADRDLAIKDLVKSAFGHAGQKCSAASLAILEAEVYDDPAFRRQLRDAAASLQVGPSTDPASVVTPLIRPPGTALLSALTKLDPGEEWLLEPRQIGPDPCLWSAGIKLGVKPDSWFRRTECFGPVLGLIRADDFDHAIRIQNDSAFGLTAGIHSLDEAEIARWRDRVEAGNLYINRAITGAIVQRQPFGGWKSSNIGPGAKAGGPNYVNLFTQLDNAEAPDGPSRISAGSAPRTDCPDGERTDRSKRDPSFNGLASDGLTAPLIGTVPAVHAPQAGPLNKKVPRLGAGPANTAAAESYRFWWRAYFSRPHDPSGLKAESNVLRYRPCRGVILRLEQNDEATLQLAHLAATTCGVNLHVSLASQETDAQFVTRLATLAQHADFLRTVRPPSGAVLAAAYDAGLHWIDAPILTNGRFELPRWLREQAVSETRHRYGQLMETPSPHGSEQGPSRAPVSAQSKRSIKGRQRDCKTSVFGSPQRGTPVVQHLR